MSAQRLEKKTIISYGTFTLIHGHPYMAINRYMLYTHSHILKTHINCYYETLRIPQKLLRMIIWNHQFDFGVQKNFNYFCLRKQSKSSSIIVVHFVFACICGAAWILFSQQITIRAELRRMQGAHNFLIPHIREHSCLRTLINIYIVICYVYKLQLKIVNTTTLHSIKCDSWHAVALALRDRTILYIWPTEYDLTRSSKFSELFDLFRCKPEITHTSRIFINICSDRDRDYVAHIDALRSTKFYTLIERRRRLVYSGQASKRNIERQRDIRT